MALSAGVVRAHLKRKVKEKARKGRGGEPMLFSLGSNLLETKEVL